MLRSHKKNILIGLLVMGVFGVVYGFLSSRPEMVADEKLRVSEAPRPEFDHVLNRTSAFKPDDSDETVLDDGLLDDGLLDGSSAVMVSESEVMENLEEGEIVTQKQDVVTIQSENVAAQEVDEAPEQEVIQISSAKDPFVNPFKSGARRFTPEDVVQEKVVVTESALKEPQRDAMIDSSNSDVALLSDQAGFLDLNLTKREPIEVVLLEGDEIIIDDVNESLEKYKPLVDDMPDQSMVSPVVLGSNEFEDQSSGLNVLPEPDAVLMKGNDAVSLEYQASYKKLKSITEKLDDANKENKVLKNQFSHVADDNRKLAQIIRDIDEKIKVLTVSN